MIAKRCKLCQQPVIYQPKIRPRYWHDSNADKGCSSGLNESEVEDDIDGTIAKAIDTNNAKLAGEISDSFRWRGETYAAILARVQKVRPAVSQASWDALMSEADNALED